jgi:hypothetical protein
MMGEIYSRACNVLVQMRRLSNSEIEALFEMDILNPDMEERERLRDYDHKHILRHVSDSAREGIQTLIRNPYWSRKWITQEITLAGPNATLVTSPGYIHLHNLAKFFVRVQSCDLRRVGELLSGLSEMTRRRTDLYLLLGAYNYQ